VPNLTFWATFEAVVNVGAVPKCVDSDAFGQLDLSSLKSAIDYFNPQCVIIAHLFGYSSNNLFQIRQICFDKNIPLLEDGAQCFGAKFKGEPLLKGAFISTTSFYPAKVLGAAGDAGAVFTNDRDLSEKVRTLSNHGRSSHYGYSNVGWNSRMDSIQAAYLNIAIDFLPHRIESRIDIINKYYLELPKLGINVIKPSVDFFENGYLNVCLFDNITEKRYVEDKLRKSTIGFGNVYPEILTKQKGAELYNNYKIVAKNSEKFSTSVLNLPVFPYLNEIEFQYIIETLKQS
jgi:dTDP-4-amino-4,6-dideoxygalactose transaminase